MRLRVFLHAHAVAGRSLFLIDLRPLAPGGCLQCPDMWFRHSDHIPANAPHYFLQTNRGKAHFGLFVWFYTMQTITGGSLSPLKSMG